MMSEYFQCKLDKQADNSRRGPSTGNHVYRIFGIAVYNLFGNRQSRAACHNQAHVSVTHVVRLTIEPTLEEQVGKTEGLAWPTP